MRTRLIILALAVAGMFLVGCDNDDDGIKVDKAIENAFKQQYPDATRVEWEKKSDYYVASFRQNNTEAEAWYNTQAVWHMTETDVIYADLPQAVKTAFEASEYAGWKVDDIDKLECLGMETVYIIEVEQGNTEYDLYYSPEGVFIKAVADGSGSGYLPPEILPAIKEYIATKYPQARIADIEKERNMIEVDIVDGRISRELLFTLEGEWVQTKTEVRQSDVPQIVLTAWSNSQYGSWKIDDIDHYITTTGEYYIFELESGSQEIDLKIDSEGNIL